MHCSCKLTRVRSRCSEWYMKYAKTLATLVGQSVADPKAAAAGLPPPDSLDMWPMLSGTN